MRARVKNPCSLESCGTNAAAFAYPQQNRRSACESDCVRSAEPEHRHDCPEHNVEEVGKNPVEAKFASGGRVRMDLCSSGIELIGTDQPRLRVSYHPERADVKVRIQVSGDRADLQITNCPRITSGRRSKCRNRPTFTFACSPDSSACAISRVTKTWYCTLASSTWTLESPRIMPVWMPQSTAGN